MPKPLLMYDLDGTILDTTELIYQSYKHVFNIYLPELIIDEAMFHSFLGPSLDDTFSKYLDAEMVEKAVNEYIKFNLEKHHVYLKEFNNVKEYLYLKKDQGYTNVIVTTKRRKASMLGLELSGIDNAIDMLITLEDVKIPKPDPEGIQKALEAYNTNIGIYLGDNKSDMLAAKKANVKAVGVSWAPKGIEQLELADAIIDKIEDLDKIIQEVERDGI